MIGDPQTIPKEYRTALIDCYTLLEIIHKSATTGQGPSYHTYSGQVLSTIRYARRIAQSGIDPKEYNGSMPYLNIALWFGVSYSYVHHVMELKRPAHPGIENIIRIACNDAKSREEFRRERSQKP